MGCGDGTLPIYLNVGTVTNHTSPGWMAGASECPMYCFKPYSHVVLWNLSLELTILLTAGMVADQGRGGAYPLLHSEVL